MHCTTWYHHNNAASRRRKIVESSTSSDRVDQSTGPSVCLFCIFLCVIFSPPEVSFGRIQKKYGMGVESSLSYEEDGDGAGRKVILAIIRGREAVAKSRPKTEKRNLDPSQLLPNLLRSKKKQHFTVILLRVLLKKKRKKRRQRNNSDTNIL